VITSELRPRSIGQGEVGVGARIFHRRTREVQQGAGCAYTVRMASTREDVRAAQTLRFLVFNLEMQEGL
jgi:putative hemolysin